jgi:hypothetical protein
MSVRRGLLCFGLRRCAWICAAAVTSCVTLVVVAGCIGRPANPAVTEPVTVSDTATTQPVYWYDRPASVTVDAANFERLWRAAETAARLHGFSIDREERRSGLLTTDPLISSQFFEFWRRDVKTPEDSARASLATHRRTLRFEFEKLPDGRYEVTPKALVERQSVTERRITSVVLYRGSVGGSGAAGDIPHGTREADEGILIPPRYWYAIGRDEALEQSVAKAMREDLK